MAIGVKIDLENIYSLDRISNDFRIAAFQTPLQSGKSASLLVKISEESHELLPNVYNLAFGPLDKQMQIDDSTELAHSDYSKVFSTILSGALRYLNAYPDRFVGIDGSENRRAWYYWRILQANFAYLARYFDIYGLKYYVRISRFGKLQYENPFDFEDIYPFPDKLVKIDEWPRQMYNYFIFGLNQKS